MKSDAAIDAPKRTSALNGMAVLNNNIALRKQEYYNTYRKDRERQIIEYLWGNHGIRRSAKESENDYVLNIVYKDYRLTLSMLARDTPSIKLIPIVPGLGEQSEILTKIINHVFSSNDFIVRLTKMLSYGLPLGRGFLKVTWDGSMRMGLGGIRIEAGDPRNILFMPGIGEVRNSLILSEAQDVDKLTLYHRYPDQWRAINELFRKDRKEDDGSVDMIGSEYPDGTWLNTEGSSQFLDGAARKEDELAQIRLWQQWIIDPTTVKMAPRLYERLKNNKAFKALDSDKQDELMNKPLYPRGKLCIFSGSHMFDSRPNMFPSFPYMQYTNQFIPGNKPGDELGMGEYDNLLEAQDILNGVINQAQDADEAAGTRTITDADIDADEWAELPNGIFQVTRIGQVQQVTTPGAPPELRRSLTDIFGIAQQIQNRSDISQGQNPSGARSGDQVVELSELANRVMVTQTHSLEATVRSVVRYAISMVGAFYQQGVHYPDTIDLQGVNPDAFEIVVKAGLNLPASDSQKLMWLRTLAELKSIDPEVMLQATPDTVLENKAEVLERMRGKWRAAEEAIAQQQSAEVNAQNASAQKDVSQAQSNVIPMVQPEAN